MVLHSRSAVQEPRVSVVVTNYNYGHFIAACLDSLSGQTRPPDQVVVVDDGSQDDSVAILRQRSGIELILQGNSGQAGAFNAGFAASTGDIVLFLDADDMLAPTAIETILAGWTDQGAGVSFDLELVDQRGARLGRYPMATEPTVQRARILKHLAISFMPTSGNAFRRSAIEWAFPLPVARWRISADAVLVRAAFLAGQIRHLPQALGAYRVHGHNNYFLDGLSQMAQVRRGLLDIADAGLDLVELGDRAAAPPYGAAERALLLAAALRTRLKCEALGAPLAADPGFLRRWQRLAGGRAAPLRALLATSPRLRRWLERPGDLPAWTARLAPRPAPGMLAATRQALAPPVPLRLGTSRLTLAGPRLQALCPGPEWFWRDDGQVVLLCAAEGGFTLQRNLRTPVAIQLDLDVVEGRGPLLLELLHQGAPVLRATVAGRQTLRALLPGVEPFGAVADAITLRLTPVASGARAVWRRRRARRAWLRLYQVTLEAEPARKTGAVLPVGAMVPAEPLSMALRRGALFEEASADAPARPGFAADDWLVVAAPTAPGVLALAIRLGPGQEPGWLGFRWGNLQVYEGEVGPGDTCILRFPPNAFALDRTVELALLFRPADPGAEARVTLAALGWLPVPLRSGGNLPVLLAGTRVSAPTSGGFDGFLAEGWQVAPGEDPVMEGMSARLQLSLGPAEGSTAPVLVLDVEPVAPPAEEQPFLLLVLVEGQQAHAVRLLGQARLEVPLAPFLSGLTGDLAVDLFATLRDPEGAVDALQRHGGLRLLGLALQGGQQPPARLPAAQVLPGTGLADLLAAIGPALAQSGTPADLPALRAALCRALATVHDKALPAFLSAEALDALAALGRRLPAAPELAGPPGGQGGWLRACALAMLAGPAVLAVPELRLGELPECGAAQAEAIGRYLAADPPGGGSPALVAQLAPWLVRRLEEARTLILAAEADDPRRVAALAFRSMCRGNSLLFEDGPLAGFARAAGRALSAELVAEGRTVAWPARPAGPEDGAGRRVRLGILMRHTGPAPETWIVRGLLAGLPAERFEITLITTEQMSDPAPQIGWPVQHIGLAGLPDALAVTTIRAAGLDVLLLGAFFHASERLGRIVGQRLAPRQIALSAIAPMTTGLATVDEFVLGDLSAPPGAEADYTETTLRAPGTGQVFAFEAAAPPPEDQILLRARLGVPADAVLMVCGAMLDKIGAPLLAAWLQILAGAPDTVLLLYPFAPNWKRRFDEPAFMERLRQAAQQQGVDPGRIRVLAPISHDEVRRLLAGADLYLDSFPYSGATTTVEALSTGLPVVARACASQRGHQAAGWLAAFGLADLVAADTAAYVALAVALAGDPARRRDLVQRIGAGRAAALAQAPFLHWLADHLAGGIAPPAPAPRYMFHHMAKTGGTSLRKMLAAWFWNVNDYREPWSTTLPAPQDLSVLTPRHLLCGHFAADGMPLLERYPELADTTAWRRICFLRDPFETALSIWFFERANRGKHDPDYVVQPLGEFLRSYEGHYLGHFECTPETWRETLERYWFIGTLERLGECMAFLAEALDQPPPETILQHNRTARDPDLVLDPADVADFTRRMAVEFEIYRHVSARLDRQLKEGPGWVPSEDHPDQFPR